MPRFTKRYKIESNTPNYTPIFSRKKRRLYSMGYGKRKFYKSVARTRGALFTSPEIKYFDFGTAEIVQVPAANITNLGTSVTTCPYWPAQAGPVAIGCCFAPKLGNDINNRIGRKCAIHKIRINGQLYCPTQTAQAEPDTPLVVRAVLFVDKQANSSQAKLNDIFSTETALTNAFSSINVAQSLSNLGRFRVLKDKKIIMGDFQITGTAAGPALVQGGQLKNFKMHIKFKKPLIVHFNSTNGGTYADIVENSVNVNFVASNTASAPYVQYIGRVTYTDL